MTKKLSNSRTGQNESVKNTNKKKVITSINKSLKRSHSEKEMKVKIKNSQTISILLDRTERASRDGILRSN
jgi:hypothetical protein